MNNAVNLEAAAFTSGQVRLAGTLYLPDNPRPCPALTVLHAASGGERGYHFYSHLTQLLPEMGIAVLLFDRRGSGESGGVFETADFAELAGDGLAAIEYLGAHPAIDPARVGIYGISQGGWIAPLMAAKNPAIAFQVIVSGCGVTPAEQMDYSAAYTLREAGVEQAIVRQALALRALANAYFRGEIRRAALVAELREHAGEPWYSLAYLPAPEEIPEDVHTSKWFYEMDHDPLLVWRSVHCPTLFLYAEDDRWVPLEESMQRYKLATAHLPEVRFERIPGSDHLMYALESGEARRVSSEYLKVLSGWLKARLQLDPD